MNTNDVDEQIERNKHVVRRLISEVMNGGDLDVIDELYHPKLAAARRWIEPFLASFSDIDVRIHQLIAENDAVAARLSCSGTHTGPWLNHSPTGHRFTDIAEVYIFHITNGRITRAWDWKTPTLDYANSASTPPRDQLEDACSPVACSKSQPPSVLSGPGGPGLGMHLSAANVACFGIAEGEQATVFPVRGR